VLSVGPWWAQPTAAGPLQVIATEYDGFWVWGWENPSLPGEAKSALGAALANDELFAGIRACMKFALDEESADSLAQLAAVRTGWLGAYPAPHGETIVHLALKLTPIANHSVEPADNIWCSFCGRLPQQVKNMVRAAEDCAVCSICIRTFCDILDESPPGESSDILGPCLLCGTRGSRVMGNFGAGCIACIRSVQDLAQ